MPTRSPLSHTRSCSGTLTLAVSPARPWLRADYARRSRFVHLNRECLPTEGKAGYSEPIPAGPRKDSSSATNTRCVPHPSPPPASPPLSALATGHHQILVQRCRQCMWTVSSGSSSRRRAVVGLVFPLACLKFSSCSDCRA